MDTSAGSDVCINKRYILACTGSAHARSNHRFVVEALARVKVFPLWLGTGAGSAVPLHDLAMKDEDPGREQRSHAHNHSWPAQVTSAHAERTAAVAEHSHTITAGLQRSSLARSYVWASASATIGHTSICKGTKASACTQCQGHNHTHTCVRAQPTNTRCDPTMSARSVAASRCWSMPTGGGDMKARAANTPRTCTQIQTAHKS
eukprot:1157779-Pelagomonas_calceolata.AAC.25